MKDIKVFAIGSHQTKERNSGVDYARVAQPMKFLNGYTDSDVRFCIDFYDINNDKQDSWEVLAKKYDVIFLNYTLSDWQYAAMGMYVHKEGKKIIMDVDDAIWYVQQDNVAHDAIKKMDGSYLLTCILDDVDGVVTTNGYLRNVIVDKTYKTHDKILVAGNHVDLTQYNLTFPAKDTGEIMLLHYGSTSHFNDLLDTGFVDGIDRIMKTYPQVKFKAVGSFIPQLRDKWGARYINDFGDVDIYRWIKNKFPIFMEEADILVTPLLDTVYNRCKSDIHFVEIGSAAKPGVYSATRPYNDTVEHGKTGYLASTADEWFDSLQILVESKVKRQEIGNNAFEKVVSERQMKNNVKPYADFFKKILDIS